MFKVILEDIQPSPSKIRISTKYNGKVPEQCFTDADQEHLQRKGVWVELGCNVEYVTEYIKTWGNSSEREEKCSNNIMWLCHL